MNIGLALSGGGYRATVFHLGMLEWLARTEQLADVKFLSTVSGGSICAGLVYAAAGNRWPDNDDYRKLVVPKIKKWMTSVDLQNAITVSGFWRPFSTRADDLARLMEKKFQMKSTMQDIPQEPRWIINTTAYESGKLFRIEQRRMGDYILGYVENPRIKISEAVAASAGFPVGIGPLILEPDDYEWLTFENNLLQKPIATPPYKEIHLWDGGVYDNMGDEPLFDPGVGWRDDVDFLVVSDASGLFNKHEAYNPGVEPLKRLLDIATSQVRAVRSRALVDFMKQHPQTGLFLQIDNSVKGILEQAEEDGFLNQPAPADSLNHVLTPYDVAKAASMSTHIHKLKKAEFELLFRQGFEVANATYYGYMNQTRWLDYDPDVR